MRKTAIGSFRKEFHSWIKAHNQQKGFDTDPECALQELEIRVGTDALSHIGSALLNGWLETEQESGRGYFVREADRPGRRGGLFMMINRGDRKADPCWENFVQLADYAEVRTIAERRGQVVRLEDRLMDLTVRTEDRLILYIEQKRTSQLAEVLLKKMRRYGETGFNLADDDTKNDPLRKAKYLVRDIGGHPIFFGLSAPGFKQLFKVEYGEGNRFHLIEDQRPFSAPMVDHPGNGGANLPRSAVDDLALEIARICPEVWISLGTGQTEFNFYAPLEDGSAIVIGIYKSGEAWTDNLALGPERARRFASAMEALGIVIDWENAWTRWKGTGGKFDLAATDPAQIAQAVRQALDVNTKSQAARE